MNESVARKAEAVHAEDVERVRRKLRAAIEEAGTAWLPADAILDALALELAAFAARHAQAAHVASLLSQLAQHYRISPDDRRH